MSKEFWKTHMRCAEVARILGFSRQNVHTRIKKGTIPVDYEGDEFGVPEQWVMDNLAKRNRDKGGA